MEQNQQVQQGYMEKQQQRFEQIQEQIANMQIGIQNAQGKYIEELQVVKKRQDHLWTNQNNLCNGIMKEQDLLGKEIQDIKKWQMSETLSKFKTTKIDKVMEASLKSDLEAGSASQAARPPTPTTAPTSTPAPELSQTYDQSMQFFHD
ncbi:hypothetical protein PIB30_027613 [Stylosanthes scabra]|uniref:Uncharacterized protein n=1 Tax=Stylosanthes scabra TaxID=79078 RepID=A0ABU6Y9A4_9FABA|nr:hypothetical protein [Stylosanthes scabra]